MYKYRDRGGTVVKVQCYKCINIGTAVGQWLRGCATNIYIYIDRGGTVVKVLCYLYIYIYKGTAVAPWLRCCATNIYIQGVTGGTDQTSGGCSLC